MFREEISIFRFDNREMIIAKVIFVVIYSCKRAFLPVYYICSASQQLLKVVCLFIP